MAEDIDDLLDEVESKFCKNPGPAKGRKNTQEQSRYSNYFVINNASNFMKFRFCKEYDISQHRSVISTSVLGCSP
jgi:hypothetical protein